MQLFPSMLWFTFKLLLSIKWFNLNQGCLGHFASELHEQLSNLFGSASIARRNQHEATNNQIEISRSCPVAVSSLRNSSMASIGMEKLRNSS
jgi:hypothetical protein